MAGAQAGHMAGKGAMYQSVDMLAQPGGDYSAFKADRSFIPKMSSPPFCFAKIVVGPRRGCSAAGSRCSPGIRCECTYV